MYRERSVFIDASPRAVFDYVSDILRHPEWTAQRIEIKHTGGPASGVGAQFESTVHFVGKLSASIRVVEAESPARFVYRCEDSSGTYIWTFALLPEGGGTRLTQSFDRISAPFYIKAIQPSLMYPLMGKGMFDKGLAGIRANLESVGAATSA